MTPEVKTIKLKDMSIDKKTLSYSLINSSLNINPTTTSPLLATNKNIGTISTLSNFNVKKKLVQNIKETNNTINTISSGPAQVGIGVASLINFKSPKHLIIKPKKIDHIQKEHSPKSFASPQGMTLNALNDLNGLKGLSLSSGKKGNKIIKK